MMQGLKFKRIGTPNTGTSHGHVDPASVKIAHRRSSEERAFDRSFSEAHPDILPPTLRRPGGITKHHGKGASKKEMPTPALNSIFNMKGE